MLLKLIKSGYLISCVGVTKAKGEVKEYQKFCGHHIWMAHRQRVMARHSSRLRGPTQRGRDDSVAAEDDDGVVKVAPDPPVVRAGEAE